MIYKKIEKLVNFKINIRNIDYYDIVETTIYI